MLVQTRPANLGWFMDRFLGAAAVAERILGDPHEEVLDFLRAARDMAVSACRLSSQTPGLPIELRISGQSLTLPATGPLEGWDAAVWMNAFAVPLILRDGAALDELCAVDEASLRHPSSQLDEYRYRAADALRAFWTNGDWRTAVQEAVELARLENTRVLPDPDYARRVSSMLLMLDPLHRGDPEGFNAALRDALEGHRGYWSRSGGPSSGPLGVLAFGPLGLACLAHDRGIGISVESAYMPGWLLRGEL